MTSCHVLQSSDITTYTHPALKREWASLPAATVLPNDCARFVDLLLASGVDLEFHAYTSNSGMTFLFPKDHRHIAIYSGRNRTLPSFFRSLEYRIYACPRVLE